MLVFVNPGLKKRALAQLIQLGLRRGLERHDDGDAAGPQPQHNGRDGQVEVRGYPDLLPLLTQVLL